MPTNKSSSSKSSKNRSNTKSKKKTYGFWSRNAKVMLLFVLAFSVVGASLLIRSFAARGDELQAKSNATWSFNIAKRIVLARDGSYGYTLDGWGALHPFHTYGPQPATPKVTAYWRGWDIARDVAVTSWDPVNPKGYVLDGWGGIHPFGGAAAVVGASYWKGWDIARRIVIKGSGGYVLDGLGGLHPFAIGTTGVAPPKSKQAGYWTGQDIARDVIIRPDGAVGEVLTCNGGVTPVGFGTNNAPAYVKGYPYNAGRCDFVSFANYSYPAGSAIPSGVVVNGEGRFASFGGWPIKPFVASGLGKVIDGKCRYVVAEAATRCWELDDHGAIRAFAEPNDPLFTDQEQAFFAAVKKAQDEAAARAAADAARNAAGGGGVPAGCSKPLNAIGPRDGATCIRALQAAVGARVDGIWGPETQSKRNAKFGGGSGGGSASTPVPSAGATDAQICAYLRAGAGILWSQNDNLGSTYGNWKFSGHSSSAVEAAYKNASYWLNSYYSTFINNSNNCGHIAVSAAVGPYAQAQQAISNFGATLWSAIVQQSKPPTYNLPVIRR